MGDQPRKHHFVPQFYLAGFTPTGTGDGDLYVLDKERSTRWKSTAKGTAHMRDFHAIEPEANGDPMVVEKVLSQLEGQWSRVLKTVIDTQKLPTDEAIGDLMVFIAFMAVRVPRIRNVLSDFIDRVTKSQIQLQLATEEGRASFRKIVEQAGRRLADEEFDGLVQFARSGNYEANFDQTWHVQELVRMASVLAPALSLREWRLWPVGDGAPDLICSDNPVAPTWAIPMPGPLPPAFGTPNTVVSIPLNRRLALVSMIERELPELRLDRKGVAVVNTMTALYANQIYSAGPDFVWIATDHEVRGAADLLAALAAERNV